MELEKVVLLQQVITFLTTKASGSTAEVNELAGAWVHAAAHVSTGLRERWVNAGPAAGRGEGTTSSRLRGPSCLLGSQQTFRVERNRRVLGDFRSRGGHTCPSPHRHADRQGSPGTADTRLGP